MAKIPLRAYNREIENLIDRGHADEAVAHCRHILKFYPKHLDTYRLLGKAFMESERYGEAADIMQRVLSSVPDDFISQIGMSIIREDEGNLDAAIWHMERAHEIQPSNAAIQDELRRLYGRRDGVEPPKIRLTRGALVRMYARGELYPQAIAEIRAALVENPQRIDLEIILARMYFLSGQKVEATEVCSRLVSKLPYCFEANRILADVLPSTSRAEDAKVYQQRVYALDPYLMHIIPGATSSVDVPDNAVMVEHLEYDASQEEAKSPEWAQNLGRDWSDTAEEQTPAWMSSAPVEEPTDTAEKSTETGETVIPDWMAEAGWKPSTGEEQPPATEDLFTSEEIAPAEIPDWLKSIAPETPAEETSEADESTAQWIDQLIPQETAEEENIETVEEGTPVQQEEIGETPDWLTALTPEQETSTEELASSEIPSWLSDLASVTGTEETAETAPTESPDWLIQAPAESAESQPENELAEAELPDWLKEVAAGPSEEEPTEEAAEGVEAIIEEPAITAEVIKIPAENPEVEETIQPEALISQPLEENPVEAVSSEMVETPPTDDLDAAMAWMESLAAKQGAEEETLTTRPEDRVETPPDWLQELIEAEPVEEVEQPLSEELSTEEVTEQVSTEEPAAEKPVVEESASSVGEMEMDDAFAWLESLAAKQGAQEETLITAPEARSEKPPEWISELPVQEPEAAIEPEPAVESEQSATESIEEEQLPAWLEEALEEEAEPAELKIEPAEWIQEEETTSAMTEAQIENLVSEPVQVEPQEVAVEEIQQEIESQDIKEVVESVDELSQVAEDRVPDIAEQPEPEKPAEEALEEPAWAAEIPSLSEPDIIEEPTAIEEETIPDWLQGLVEEEAATPVQPEPLAEVPESQDEEAPDWLKSLQEETEETPIPGFEAQIPAKATAPLMETPVPQIEPEAEMLEPGDWDAILQAAKADLDRGRIDPGVEKFSELINSGQYLEESIHDLRDALYRFPVDISLWQTLGDAYARNNMLQDALDAYTKAEELLR